MANRILTEADIQKLAAGWASTATGVRVTPPRLVEGTGDGLVPMLLQWGNKSVAINTVDLSLPNKEFVERFIIPLALSSPPVVDDFMTTALAKGHSISIVDNITTARGSIYGPFLHNAIVAQNLKAAMRNLPDPDNEKRWEDLPLDVREGLDLIQLKVSRIVTGDPEYLDNWDDIAGYAVTVAKRIREAKKP